MNSIEKANFRRSKKWKDFRETFREDKDALTGKKLSTRFNLHHMDLNSEHYTDISKRENYLPLNKKSHDAIHFLYTYYKKDRIIISQLEAILERMKELDA